MRSRFISVLVACANPYAIEAIRRMPLRIFNLAAMSAAVEKSMMSGPSASAHATRSSHRGAPLSERATSKAARVGDDTHVRSVICSANMVMLEGFSLNTSIPRRDRSLPLR